MDQIVQGAGDWEEVVATALATVPRPIVVRDRFAAREVNGDPVRDRYARSTLPPARPAATLLLLYPGADGELTIPLTVRRETLRAHAGEISLPGGAVDAGDTSAADAALREAWEELGVEAAGVRILGELDSVWIPVSNFELRPFVGSMPERPELRPHDAEVAAVIELPVRLILGDEIVVDEEFAVREFVLKAGVFRYGEHRIWGATARTLDMLATVLTEAAAR